jgi:hypothetical protein
MNDSTTPSRSRFVTRDLYRAFGSGLLLGSVVWWLGELRRGSMESFAMAVVFAVSASASFVLYTLGSANSEPPKKRTHEVHLWLVAIGAGIVLASYLLDWLISVR